MGLTERTEYMLRVFDMLQSTNSALLKREIVQRIRPEFRDDFDCILEVLAGKYIFGYSYWPCKADGDVRSEDNTIREVIEFLNEPMKQHDLSIANVSRYVKQTAPWCDFFEPIVNRRLRLGIGKSILPKDSMSPMLAKKYEGKIKHDKGGYVFTEKLDGNRCIAYCENGEWKFISRNGKPMHVKFDMSGLDDTLAYDGEVLSRAQTESSILLNRAVQESNVLFSNLYGDGFTETSGLINRHCVDKDLVYNIFDIMIDDVPYLDRRLLLNQMKPESKDVRILPILSTCGGEQLERFASGLLHRVTEMGGEGLMINLATGAYNHKRTDQLLKLKKVQTIDMEVVDFQWGTGKYDGMIGALMARCVTDDGKVIECKIGSGLSDEQRLDWAFNFDKIRNKIVEVAYFSLSQDSENKGTNVYSLRFPRLKSVRKDKDSTSQY